MAGTYCDVVREPSPAEKAGSSWFKEPEYKEKAEVRLIGGTFFQPIHLFLCPGEGAVLFKSQSTVKPELDLRSGMASELDNK